MAIRLETIQDLDELVKKNPSISYKVMGGGNKVGKDLPPEPGALSDNQFSKEFTKASEKTEKKNAKTKKRKAVANEENKEGEEKKKRKYGNNKIFEYEDGSISKNDRQDIFPTPEELAIAVKEELDLETAYIVAKNEYSIALKNSKKKPDKKIETLQMQIKKRSEKGRDVSKKEEQLRELFDIKKEAEVALEKLPLLEKAKIAAEEKYNWVSKRNELLKENKRLETAIYDSKKEYTRWIELKALQDAGEISELKRQVSYELQPKFINAQGDLVHAIKYLADFEYIENGKLVVEDVKAIIKKTGKPMTTPDFNIKWKILQYKFPHITFRIY